MPNGIPVVIPSAIFPADFLTVSIQSIPPESIPPLPKFLTALILSDPIADPKVKVPQLHQKNTPPAEIRSFAESAAQSEIIAQRNLSKNAGA